MGRDLKTYISNTMKEVSTDFVIFGFHDSLLKVLLLKWKGIDFWSLPGGRIFPDESVYDSANRTLKERTGLDEIFLQQFHAFGKLNRLENFSEAQTRKLLEVSLGVSLEGLIVNDRIISIGYYALVDHEKVTPVPDIYTDECRWFEISDVPALLFDHNHMIRKALKSLKNEFKSQAVGYNLLPQKFTISEIQNLYETILGRSFDRRNFHKKIMSYGFLIKLSEKREGSANKSPFLYQFDLEKYNNALENGISF